MPIEALPEENLRADLGNRLGIDFPTLGFVLAHPDNSQEVRDYIESRIAAGNESAMAQKDIMESIGTW